MQNIPAEDKKKKRNKRAASQTLIKQKTIPEMGVEEVLTA